MPRSRHSRAACARHYSTENEPRDRLDPLLNRIRCQRIPVPQVPEKGDDNEVKDREPADIDKGMHRIFGAKDPALHVPPCLRHPLGEEWSDVAIHDPPQMRPVIHDLPDEYADRIRIDRSETNESGDDLLQADGTGVSMMQKQIAMLKLH